MRRLLISLLAATLIATVGLGWVFDVIYRDFSRSEMPESNAVNHQSAITVMEQLGTNFAELLNLSDDPDTLVQQWPKTSAYQLTLEQFNGAKLPQSLVQKLQAGKPLLLESHSKITIYYFLPQHQQNLILTAPLQSGSAQNKWLPIIFTSLFYLCLLALMLLWAIPLIKRLLTLRQSAKAFGEGNLAQRVTLGSGSYIRDLEVEFNHMAQRIEDLVNDVKLLGSAVSHDLRTPLASIRFGLDTLAEEDDAKIRQMYEQRIGDNVDEMITLVETLLNYARLDQAMEESSKSTVDIQTLITGVIRTKDLGSVELNIKGLDEAIEVFGNRNYLSMVFNNLIQNALQFAHNKILIDISRSAHELIIVIADDGQGVLQQEITSVFKPFVRGSKQQRSRKGYGIGLAIVDRILHWHRASIRVENGVHLAGANFIIHLPLAK